MNITIDKTLTPENAAKKGYAWVKDVIYDPTLEDTMKDIFRLVRLKEYKIGQPVSRMAGPILKGLYAHKKEVLKN